MLLPGLDLAALEPQLATFKSDFAAALAGTLGWPPSRVRVVAVTLGSVVVSAELRYSPRSEGQALRDFEQRLGQDVIALLGPSFLAR